MSELETALNQLLMTNTRRRRHVPVQSRQGQPLQQPPQPRFPNLAFCFSLKSREMNELTCMPSKCGECQTYQ
jgi:hypothetical protein